MCIQVVHVIRGCMDPLLCHSGASSLARSWSSVAWRDIRLSGSFFLRSSAGYFRGNMGTERVGLKGEFFHCLRHSCIKCKFSFFKTALIRLALVVFCFIFLFWSFSLNFSTSISRQWLLIGSCRSYLWRRLGSLWSVSANIYTENIKLLSVYWYGVFSI